MSTIGKLRYVMSMVFGRPKMLETGTKAPQFTATDQSGTSVRLSDLAGRNVVLWFYPKADTPG